MRLRSNRATRPESPRPKPARTRRRGDCARRVFGCAAKTGHERCPMFSPRRSVPALRGQQRRCAPSSSGSSSGSPRSGTRLPRSLRPERGITDMASGLYAATFQDVLDTTQLALNLELETHRVALYTSSRNPNYGQDTGYSSTNEIVGTGYTAGGEVLTGTSLSITG